VIISDDPTVIHWDLEQLTRRYIKKEVARAPVVAFLPQEGRVALHLKPVKVTEFSVEQDH